MNKIYFTLNSLFHVLVYLLTIKIICMKETKLELIQFEWRSVPFLYLPWLNLQEHGTWYVVSVMSGYHQTWDIVTMSTAQISNKCQLGRVREGSLSLLLIGRSLPIFGLIGWYLYFINLCVKVTLYIEHCITKQCDCVCM